MVLEATILRSLCLLSDSILARSCDNLRNSQNFLFLKLARYKLETDRTSIVELRIVCKSRMLQKDAYSSITSGEEHIHASQLSLSVAFKGSYVLSTKSTFLSALVTGMTAAL